MLIYFMDIWNILRTYIWDILWPFGTSCVHVVHFFGIMYQEKSGSPEPNPILRCYHLNSVGAPNHCGGLSGEGQTELTFSLKSRHFDSRQFGSRRCDVAPTLQRAKLIILATTGRILAPFRSEIKRKKIERLLWIALTLANTRIKRNCTLPKPTLQRWILYIRSYYSPIFPHF
jgi:hypothetical protein